MHTKLAFFLWLVVGLIIYFSDPANLKDFPLPDGYLLIALPLFLAFLFSLRSLLWSIGIMAFLYLRVWGFGTPLTLISIVGFLVTVEIYLRESKSSLPTLHK